MAQSDDKTILAVKQQFSIVGNSSALNSAIERALKVAPFDLSVLIIGESGSGKEFFPQIIHRYSKRRNNRYTVVNCGAIPEGTIESELFGHVKGAFTGADKDRKGYFEETNGGTIFLDEVAEMPLATQARLLRVLQNGEYIKVGSDVVQKTNVRVVAATNKDLMKAVKEGRFREDLYYRLSTIQIDIPALRERSDDISMIVRVFAHDFAEHNHTRPVKFTDQALKLLSMYSWPGNVRQLKSLIERICVYEDGKEITEDIIKNYIPNDTVLSTSLVTANNTDSSLNSMLVDMIKKLFAEVNELKKKIKNFESSTSTNSSTIIAQNHNKIIENTPTKMISDNEIQHSNKIQSEVLLDIPSNIKATDFQVKEEKIHNVIINPSIQKSTYSKHLNEMADNESKYNMVEVESSDEEYKSLDEIEKEAIEMALIRNKGKRKITAEQLKISERTLYRKIDEYKLNDNY
ncbi:MAG: sigma 54-interacting transcriptional regulator [Muribaculaceae bacterium]